MKQKIMFWMVVLVLVVSLIAFVEAQSSFSRNSFSSGGTFSSVHRGSGQADIHRLYGSDVATYWPKLKEPLTCEAREDIILQVSPLGCEPSVVRSDLLAEQNVPVFCQISALKLNPLIDVDRIRNVRFRGDFPDEVVGVGFHPARAALQSQSRLTGTPLIDNIGYVTVVLRQQPDEREIEEFVNFTLHAQLDYDSGGGLGVGRASFLLDESSDAEWERDRNKQSFWDGQYFVRLEEANSESAKVSIYHGEKRVTTTTIDRRTRSPELFLPGFYCQAGIEIQYEGLVPEDVSATLRINDDVLTVRKGSRFLNNKCSVQRIESTEDRERVDIRCGSEAISLQLGRKQIGIRDEVILLQTGNLKEDLENGDIWEVTAIDSKNDLYVVERDGVLRNVSFEEVIRFSKDDLNEVEHDIDAETYFEKAIDDLVRVANEYPLERPNAELQIDLGEEEFDINDPYGERSLEKAIELSRRFGKQFTEVSLIELFLETYPGSSKTSGMSRRLAELYRKDTSDANKVVDVDNSLNNIVLLEINKPDSEPTAYFTWGNDEFSLVDSFNGSTQHGLGGDLGVVRLVEVNDAESVDVLVTCNRDQFEERFDDEGRGTLYIGEQGLEVCGDVLILDNVEARNLAQIVINPKVKGAQTETNFTVGIGIEKRAIELNPDKAKKKIDELNDTIARWEQVSENLGSVIKGLKTACFATAGALTVKNFLTGLGGEGFARQRVMDGRWNAECERLVSEGRYVSKDACFYANSDEIDSDVARVSEFMGEVDDELERAKEVYSEGNLFEGEVINRNATVTNLIDNEFKSGSNFNDCRISEEEGDTVGNLLDGAYYEQGDYNYDQVRDIMLNCKMINSGNSELATIGRDNLGDIRAIIESNKDVSEARRRAQADKSTNLPGMGTVLSGVGQQSVILPITQWDSVDKNQVSVSGAFDSAFVARVGASSTSGTVNEETVSLDGGEYLLGLESIENGEYTIQEVFERKNDGTYEEIDATTFRTLYNVGGVKASDSVNYHNEYLNAELRYYENAPYKGMPAIVPFDTQNGWYAAVEQTLPVFGGMAGFDDSGRPVSFFVCNVGEDGREQFFENRGKDICQLINVNTGQALDQFPGLSEVEAKRRITQAITALQDAQRAYGSGRNSARINGETISVGRPAANLPATQCQNFMSPKECALLFNVCDPVICPPSRCDFGGNYPVADVVQTGIVGSALLCLPNFVGFGGDVAIPVCLTGIQAGVDSYLSILKSHQQCLAENVETGRYVGICDEITAVYMCEFFWKQALPLADKLVPKLFEIATGGSSGGGEYLNVNNAWENTQGSIDFFTNQYAVNSFDAFNIQSTDEIGTQICKGFVSAKFPKTFETIVEPDSPPQFYAYFSTHELTDVTLPATSQYKVFYHIFAGKERGVQYQVYLKDPPESSFYSVNPTVGVVGGFIPQGEFATETIDFTAPEGYKQLCVRINGKEECGFKQVTTNFAVNAITDEFVSNELTRKDVDSQQECIAGEVNPAALLNPNIQAGVEEAIDPAVYERGVVRVCASRNPGSATDPSRFVDVGHCGDETLRCWLDTQSVDNAISDSNIGAVNSTLEELSKTRIAALEETGEVLSEAEVDAIIESLDKDLKVKKIQKDSVVEFIQIIDLTFDRTIFNYQRAALLLYRGLFHKEVAEDELGIVTEVENPGVVEAEDEEEIEVQETSEAYSFEGAEDLGGGVLQRNLVCGNSLTDIYFKENNNVGEFYIDINGNSIADEEDPRISSGSVISVSEDRLGALMEAYYGETFAQFALRDHIIKLNTKSYDDIASGNVICSGSSQATTSASGEISVLGFLADGEILRDGEKATTSQDLALQLIHNCEYVDLKYNHIDLLGELTSLDERVSATEFERRLADEGFNDVGELSVNARCSVENEIVDEHEVEIEIEVGIEGDQS